MGGHFLVLAEPVKQSVVRRTRLAGALKHADKGVLERLARPANTIIKAAIDLRLQHPSVAHWDVSHRMVLAIVVKIVLCIGKTWDEPYAKRWVNGTKLGPVPAVLWMNDIMPHRTYITPAPGFQSKNACPTFAVDRLVILALCRRDAMTNSLLSVSQQMPDASHCPKVDS